MVTHSAATSSNKTTDVRMDNGRSGYFDG